MMLLAAAATSTPALGDLLTGRRLVFSLIGVVFIALVAGRLLGARRSAGVIALSALIGWIAGASLAIVVAKRHEHGDAGFLRNLWLFVAFFTMSATVWMEMLAKPGALARARHSLSSVPRPFRDARRKGQRVQRYLQITRIAAHHGFGRSLGVPNVDEDGLAGDGSQRPPVAVRLRRALEDAGGMFVKLGQVLS